MTTHLRRSIFFSIHTIITLSVVESTDEILCVYGYALLCSHQTIIANRFSI